jgi:hypothetical protein
VREVEFAHTDFNPNPKSDFWHVLFSTSTSPPPADCERVVEPPLIIFVIFLSFSTIFIYCVPVFFFAKLTEFEEMDCVTFPFTYEKKTWQQKRQFPKI